MEFSYIGDTQLKQLDANLNANKGKTYHLAPRVGESKPCPPLAD